MDDLSRQEEGVDGGHYLPAWEVASLPAPPKTSFGLRQLIGPGLMMAGAAIGGGEWLTGPATTAKYGGALMWLATVSILLQAVYNLEVMRYTLYCGETAFVGFFRIFPGLWFWSIAYFVMDFGSIWPYLASNAAVPLVSAYLGHPPAESEQGLVQTTAYFVFLGCAIPLAFGGKIYNLLEKILVAKIVFVLGYLILLAFFFVKWSTGVEILTGFFSFGNLPAVNGVKPTWMELITGSLGLSDRPPVIDLALLGSFAAVAGQGGLTNLAFSSYAREKGWGMGSQVGAIPSIVGGQGIKLDHHGKVFLMTKENLARWRGWFAVILRDQLGIWVGACLLGVGIPALVSLEFVRGKQVTQQNVAAMTAEGLVQATGIPIFWFLTLFCGFIVLAPSQISTMDGFFRRWTDILWSGNKTLAKLGGEKVVYVYYSMMLCYLVVGLCLLRWVPSPLALVKLTGSIYNLGLGVSSFHVLVINSTLLPKPIRPNLFMRAVLVLCGLFFVAISIPGLFEGYRLLVHHSK